MIKIIFLIVLFIVGVYLVYTFRKRSLAELLVSRNPKLILSLKYHRLLRYIGLFLCILSLILAVHFYGETIVKKAHMLPGTASCGKCKQFQLGFLNRLPSENMNVDQLSNFRKESETYSKECNTCSKECDLNAELLNLSRDDCARALGYSKAAQKQVGVVNDILRKKHAAGLAFKAKHFGDVSGFPSVPSGNPVF